MNIDHILQSSDALLQPLLELLGLLVRQFVLIIADRIKHSPEELEFLLGSDVHVSEEPDFHFIQDVITVIFIVHRIQLHCIRVIGIDDFFLFLFAALSFSLCNLLGCAFGTWSDDTLVDQVDDYHYNKDKQHCLVGKNVKSSTKELAHGNVLGSVVLPWIVVGRRHHSLVSVHEDVKQQVQEYTPFHESHCVHRDCLIKSKGFSIVPEEQVFVNEVAQKEVDDA